MSWCNEKQRKETTDEEQELTGRSTDHQLNFYQKNTKHQNRSDVGFVYFFFFSEHLVCNQRCVWFGLDWFREATAQFPLWSFALFIRSLSPLSLL